MAPRLESILTRSECFKAQFSFSFVISKLRMIVVMFLNIFITLTICFKIIVSISM